MVANLKNKVSSKDELSFDSEELKEISLEFEEINEEEILKKIDEKQLI
jgi:hypothetical protein